MLGLGWLSGTHVLEDMSSRSIGATNGSRKARDVSGKMVMRDDW